MAVREITGPSVREAEASSAAPGVVGEDAELLFKEARRRRRRRRLAALSLAAAGVLLVALGYSLLKAPGSRVRARPGALSSGSRAAARVVLKAPARLAVSASGTLYIVDPTRDQIVRWVGDGRFAVVAGSGREGFSGDGGPAIRAALRLGAYSDIVVGAGGIVYFADTGNNRVRAVLPSGRIETVAGDGRGSVTGTWPPLTGSRRALRAELVNPTGLAFGPKRALYIAAQDIVALSRNGTLSYFAGPTAGSGSTPQSYLVNGTPTGLAFDRAGDMFVSTFPGLAERTAAGQIRYLGNDFRAAGGPGILTSSPDHAVLEAYGTEGIISRRVGSWPVSLGSVMSSRGVQSVIAPDRLDRPLGTERGIPNGFAPEGLAIGSNGAIYTDTNRGDGWSTVSALVEIAPDGRVLTLWKS